MKNIIDNHGLLYLLFSSKIKKELFDTFINSNRSYAQLTFNTNSYSNTFWGYVSDIKAETSISDEIPYLSTSTFNFNPYNNSYCLSFNCQLNSEIYDCISYLNKNGKKGNKIILLVYNSSNITTYEIFDFIITRLKTFLNEKRIEIGINFDHFSFF